MENKDEGLPEELQHKLHAFDESLTEVEDVLKPFLKIPVSDLHDKLGDPLQKAKLDLMVAYATNSLFWTYLITQGIDPKNHPIKDELLRIKRYMAKVQQIQDKKKMAKVDTNAAKRFIRNALWEPDSSIDQPTSHQNSPKHKKRKKGDDNESKKKKKKKKVKDD